MHQMLNRTNLRNQQILKPLSYFSKTVGFNIEQNVKLSRDPLKIVILMISLLSIVSLAAQYNFIWVYRHKSMLFYTDAICTSIQGIVSLTKVSHMVLLQSRIFNMLQTARNSIILQDLDIFEIDLPNKFKMIKDIERILHESWTNIKKQLNFYAISVFCICIWYYASGLLVNIYKTFVSPQEFDINYPFPARFPMWHDKGMEFPYFLIEYIIVGSELYLCGMSAVVFLSIYVVMSVHATALLEILCKFLSYTTTDDYVPAQERVKYLKSCIKLQQIIYEYCKNVDSIYKVEIVPYFLALMFVKCLIIFQASVAGLDNISIVFRSALYICATSVEVVLFCWNGHRLTTESSRLSQTIYTNIWYEEGSEFKFLTKMMIMRSNRYVNITVGGFTNLSLMTLLAILRSTASYCLLLREVNDKI